MALYSEMVAADLIWKSVQLLVSITYSDVSGMISDFMLNIMYSEIICILQYILKYLRMFQLFLIVLKTIFC